MSRQHLFHVSHSIKFLMQLLNILLCTEIYAVTQFLEAVNTRTSFDDLTHIVTQVKCIQGSSYSTENIPEPLTSV